jgi:lincosamide nucleotidyltransferase A/C/D/E
LKRAVPVIYRLVARTPLEPVLRSRPVQRLKKRIVSMPAERVCDVMDALSAGGARAWVAGGWGVDALLGEETRPHTDLDVVVDAEGEQRALEALASLGFEVMRREAVPGRIWSERIALSDARASVVDLHPAQLEEGGVRVRHTDGSELFVEQRDAFTTGGLAGRAVPCLSARLQEELHRGYEVREVDRRDIYGLRGLNGP